MNILTNALRLPNRLLRILNNLIRRLIRPTDDDGALGSNSHGEGNEERDGQGEKSEAHPDQL